MQSSEHAGWFAQKMATECPQARSRWFGAFWRADLNALVAMNAAVVEAGKVPWKYRFTGLTFGERGIGVISRER